MNRRAFLFGLTLSTLGAPLAVEAQQRGKVSRIGFLAMSPASASPYFAYFREGLRDLGWIEGRNIVTDYRSADGAPERFPALAAELVRLPVDVILALVPGALFAAKSATQSIPIVMVAAPDPVELRLVASLARPGGNITGVTTLSADMSAKQLELLKQLVPNVSRVAVVSNPTNPWHPHALRLITENSRRLELRLQIIYVQRPDEFVTALDQAQNAQAVLALADPMTVVHCGELATLAMRRRLPTMVPVAECVQTGGLASYWPNSEHVLRRAAWYVDALLKGAKAADLPIEQPTRFELVINLKTAKALGLTIPPSVLGRADQVVE